MKKIMIIFGTRPEAIKMAPLYIKLKELSSEYIVSLCVTAQHREMLDQVLNLFKLHPDFDLNIMTPGQDLGDITVSILEKVKKCIKKVKPDLILVHGDTTTAFASALAAFYEVVKIGHVEAGLRTGYIHAPFPEEFNRCSISLIADYHFCPTELTKNNLISQKIEEGKIFVTGNTVIDSLKLILSQIENNFELNNKITKILNEALKFNWKNSKFILITGHRRENFGNGFYEICKAINILASQNPKIHFVYPVHLNPNVQETVFNNINLLSNVHLVTPFAYEPFIFLLKYSYLVLTDSGGVQEEAPSLGKPVLVMRDVTERVEGIQSGSIRLIGANAENIIYNVNNLLLNDREYMLMSNSINPYGDGTACEKIVNHIREFL
jgi:UDP-N-acetylglucosamine 2-epimerase (non-hydrolysing)